MNLTQYMAQRRNGTYVSAQPRPVVVAPVAIATPEVPAFVIAMAPEREPIRLPRFNSAARCFRKCYESSGRRGRKPRYKNVRQGGLCHRKHVAARCA